MAETPRATIDDPCPDPETDGQHCFRCPDACCHCGARKHQAAAPAAPSVGEPTPEQDETKPLTDRERELILQRCRNHEAGHDTGLTSRAVIYLYGYEALVAALRSSLEEARKDSERWQSYAEHVEHCVECGQTGWESCWKGKQLHHAANRIPDDG